MKYFFIGLPGSGKTSLGRQLSEKLSIPFFDLDREVEILEGKEVYRIFEEKGESYFRQLESQELKKLCEMDRDTVVATGGGAPCYFLNMDLMNKSGRTIFLDIPLEVISHRIAKSDLTKRPMFKKLTEQQILDKLTQLKNERVSFYRMAQKIVAGNKVGITDLMIELNS